MEKGKKVLGLSAAFLVMVIASLFIGAVSAAATGEIIVDTEKGVPGFWTEPARDLPGNWWYVQDHPDSSADGWFDTKAYPPGQVNGSFWYTISFPDMDECKGIWMASLPHSGNYEVFAWIPDPDPFDPYLDESTPPSDYLPTKKAQYKIFHNDGVTTVTIDQNVNKGRFTSLGVFEFDSTARVELSNNGVEFWRCVAFDAVKFVAVEKSDYTSEVTPPEEAGGKKTFCGSVIDTFTYDANGNMISGSGVTFVYNDANQLVKIIKESDGSTIAEYLYDSNGQRVKKVEGDVTIYYIGDYVETRINDGNVDNTSYYFANNERVARKDPDGSKYYYHGDHLGSTSVVTDETGTKSEKVSYYPYGTVKERVGEGSTYLFTDQEFDDESGLYYYGARYYNTELTRFTQPDTIIQDTYNPQNLNKYAYVLNNPLRYTDPTGHQFVQSPMLEDTPLTLQNRPNDYKGLSPSMTDLMETNEVPASPEYSHIIHSYEGTKIGDWELVCNEPTTEIRYASAIGGGILGLGAAAVTGSVTGANPIIMEGTFLIVKFGTGEFLEGFLSGGTYQRTDIQSSYETYPSEEEEKR